MVLPERSIECHSESAIFINASTGSERTARIESSIPKGRIERTVPRVCSGLCEYIHARKSRVMVFGGIRIELESNLAYLRFRRQLSTAKPIYIDNGAGPGHLPQYVLELFRIIRH